MAFFLFDIGCIARGNFFWNRLIVYTRLTIQNFESKRGEMSEIFQVGERWVVAEGWVGVSMWRYQCQEIERLTTERKEQRGEVRYIKEAHSHVMWWVTDIDWWLTSRGARRTVHCWHWVLFLWEKPISRHVLWFSKGFFHGNTKSVSERKIQTGKVFPICFL